MKIWLTICVDSNDQDLDLFSESTVAEDFEEGRRVYDCEVIATYNGIPVEDLDYDTAQELLIEHFLEVKREAV